MREVRNGSFPKPIFKKARQRTPFGLAAAGVRSPLVAELADAYPEWMKAIRSANTYAWYRRLLQNFCAKYPLLKVEELRSFHVQQWVDAPPHLSKSSRRNYIRSVKACVRWALHQGYIEMHRLWGLPIPANVYRDVTVPLGVRVFATRINSRLKPFPPLRACRRESGVSRGRIHHSPARRSSD